MHFTPLYNRLAYVRRGTSRFYEKAANNFNIAGEILDRWAEKIAYFSA